MPAYRHLPRTRQSRTAVFSWCEGLEPSPSRLSLDSWQSPTRENFMSMGLGWNGADQSSASTSSRIFRRLCCEMQLQSLHLAGPADGPLFHFPNKLGVPSRHWSAERVWNFTDVTKPPFAPCPARDTDRL